MSSESLLHKEKTSLLFSFTLIHALVTSLLLFFYLPWPWPLRPSLVLQIFAFAWSIQAMIALVFYLPATFLFGRAAPFVIASVEGLRFFVFLTDIAVFSLLQIHLDNPSIWEHLRHPEAFKYLGVNFGLAGLLLLFLFLGFVLQGLVLRFWRGFYTLKFRLWLSPYTAWVLAFLVVSGSASGAWVLAAHPDHRSALEPYLPLYRSFEWQRWRAAQQRTAEIHLQKRVQALRYPLQPIHLTPKDAKHRPHILLIASESLRYDALNPADMPQMSSYLQKHPAIRSLAHFSPGHQTWEGIFSLIYGINGHHRTTFRGLSHPPQTIEIFKKLGYKTYALQASSIVEHGYAPQHKVFDRLIDHSHLPAVRGDEAITREALSLLHSQRSLPLHKRQPLFLLLFYMSTHYPYTYRPNDRHFRPDLPENHHRIRINQNYREGLWNRYRNSVRFLDSQISHLLRELQPETRAGDLAWALVGDHGEEFWDYGAFGHAAMRLNNPRTQTAFALSLPRIPAYTVPLSSHVDLFPTFLDAMGVSLRPSLYSDGDSLLRLYPPPQPLPSLPPAFRPPSPPLRPELRPSPSVPRPSLPSPRLASSAQASPSAHPPLLPPSTSTPSSVPSSSTSGLPPSAASSDRYVAINGYGFPSLTTFALATERWKIFARRDPHFRLEVNGVLDKDDQPTRWTMPDIEPTLRAFMRDVDRFTPGFQLWRSPLLLQRPLPSYPFSKTIGILRTPQRPDLRPWARAGDPRAFLSTTPPPVRYKVGFIFGGMIEIVGYNVDSKRIRRGDDLVIETVFRCIKPLGDHWRLFFHLHLRQPPHMVGADHILVQGTYPEAAWKPGTYIRDIYAIPSTNEWHSGPGDLRIGMYNRITNARISVPLRYGSGNAVSLGPFFFD